VAVLGYGRGGTGPPNLAQAPKFLIGSVIISLSRCCIPSDEGPARPQIFFLEPPLLFRQGVPDTGTSSCEDLGLLPIFESLAGGTSICRIFRQDISLTSSVMKLVVV